ncbi:glycosyltransferase family 2 protein [Runella slithyformis]|uniref:Glycosyl transferase family 2 n=1 Tax=Runella slithyformis (strain ATCC 29530 / DSM 19594 / LMG 11500 / NCIMB 11436 / LSU 4) TaxID=761193 RepID=A0A7U3ZNB8_RUNSL|nr:glycosyltransferase family 2 protein [Runella slithyformis]AEI50359.1 glycosyl transferase family 2 [Runella slithyformis DSM 19594]
MLPTKLLLVVPCYNEEEILVKTHRTLQEYYKHLEAERLIAPESMICFVNDGSRDRTWPLIEGICQQDPKILGIKLSRNFGHQSAILAGLTQYTNDFDCFITIDADLQDDIAAIEKMLEQHRDGAMVVYGVRDDRSNDSWFKRTTAESFYTLMRWMGVPVVFNHADFRLMDRRILEEFAHFKEVNLFLRGIIPLIGFRSEKVFYKRLEREAGETKYPLKKMLLFAWNGVTSFSTFPMRLVLYFGVFNFLIAVAIAVYIGTSYLFGSTVAGWTSIVLPMTFFSGANMIAIGLIGEYIGKIYEEVKGRPRYIIESVAGREE